MYNARDSVTDRPPRDDVSVLENTGKLRMREMYNLWDSINDRDSLPPSTHTAAERGITFTLTQPFVLDDDSQDGNCMALPGAVAIPRQKETGTQQQVSIVSDLSEDSLPTGHGE